jgi:signal transduction histidine kinase
VVGGYVDLLLSGKLGGLTEQQTAVLKEINESIARLRNFTDEFLSYYAMQSAADMNCGENDLNHCISEVFRIWAPQFTKQQIAHYVLFSDALPKFSFDYYKVQHVVSNLLDNALKFTPSGGSVWIETQPHFWNRRLAQTAWSQPERRKARTNQPNAARVTISDSGPGIAPEFHQEVFEQFRRLSQDEPNQHGRGIGLASAKRLVEMHGGKIWVESSPGQGSVFRFTVPLAPDDETIEGE